MSLLLKARLAEIIGKDATGNTPFADGTLQKNAPQYVPTNEWELPVETIRPTGIKKIEPGSKGIPGAMSSTRFAGQKLAMLPTLGDEDKSMFGDLDSYKDEPSVPNTKDVRYPQDQEPIRKRLPEGVAPSVIDQIRDRYMRSPEGGIAQIAPSHLKDFVNFRRERPAVNLRDFGLGFTGKEKEIIETMPREFLLPMPPLA